MVAGLQQNFVLISLELVEKKWQAVFNKGPSERFTSYRSAWILWLGFLLDRVFHPVARQADLQVTMQQNIQQPLPQVVVRELLLSACAVSNIRNKLPGGT